MKYFYTLLTLLFIPLLSKEPYSIGGFRFKSKNLSLLLIAVFFLHFNIISVIAQPTDATISGDATICVGNSTNLIVTINGGNGTYRVELSDGTIADPYTSGDNITVNPSTTTVYTLVDVSDSDGSATTLSGSATVTVNPLPAAAGTISGTASVCQGATSVAYSVGAIANATSYAWNYSGSGATINGSGNSVTITFASNATGGNLTVQGTNSCGSGTVSANYPITVNSLPTANNQNKTAESDSPGGNTATVNLTALENDISEGTGTVSWFSDALLNNSISTPDSYSVTDGVPVYALVDNGNCTKTAQAVYTINSKPNSSGLPSPTYNEDQVVSDINLNNYFSDPEDGSNLTYTIENITVTGILNASISSNLLSITLILNQSGSTVITIRATDTDGAYVEDDLSILVDPVNDLPTSANRTVTTNEDVDYTFSSSDFAFTDVETSSLVSISITTLPGQGQLLLNNNPISAGTDILVGQISNLKFSPDINESGDPYTSFLFTVSDGTDNSSPANTITINVNPVNDPPTSAPSSFTTDEDTEYAFTSSDFPFTDTDGGTLSSVRILSLPSKGTLEVNTNPITAPANISIANINSGLFTYTPDLNENGTPYSTFNFEVNDGQDNSSGNYAMTINVIAKNDRPTFDLQASHSSNENDNTQTISGFASNINDGDPEVTQSITFVVTQTSSTGIITFSQAPTISSTGTLTYRAQSNTNGSATFDVYCSDDGVPGQNSIIKSFTINVAGENGAPSFELNGNPPAVNEDPGVVTEPAFAFNIDDGDIELTQNLTFNLSKTGGLLQFNVNPAIDASTGNLTYTPAANSNGTATYSVTLSDDGTPIRTSSSTSFTITVNALNDPPTGSDEVKSINEDATYTFQGSDFSFSDIDGHTFAGIQIISEETDGELKYNGVDVIIGQICSNVNLLTFIPTPNENNNDQSPYATFQFKVLDSSGDESNSNYTFTINVNPINDNPTSADASVSTNEGITYTFAASDFPFSDVDGHSFNGIRIVGLESRGRLLYQSNDVTSNLIVTNIAQLTFEPVPNENGSPYTSFDFQVRDSQGAYSLTSYEMSISVGSVNDRPTGANESITFLEDNNYTFSPADFTFNDVDGHLFAGIQIITVETKGDLEYNGIDVESLDICSDVTQLVFKPASNENGTPYATFTFKIRDNSGSLDLSQADYTMTINVTAVNDPPSFTISDDPPAINEDAGPQTVNNFAAAINDGDPELNQTLTFITTIQNTTGNLTFVANPSINTSTGELTYNVSNNTNGTATISVRLRDNGSGTNTSPTQQFTITVNSINDAPTLNPIADPAAINEDAPEQTVDLSGITAGANENQTITISAVSSNPSLIPNPVNVEYTSPSGIGSVKYTPAANINGTATISVTANDGQASNNMITRAFDVVVNPINDPPTIDPIANPPAIPENAIAQVIDFSGVSPGAGPDEVFPNQTVTITAASDNPTLIPDPLIDYENNSTGQLTFQPLQDQNGIAVITLTITDNQPTNNTTEISFTVNVSSVNNPPTLDDISDPSAISEDAGQQVISLSGITAGGGENQTLSVSATSDNQALIPDANINVIYTSPSTAGSIQFTASPDQFGIAAISVLVDDGGDINTSVQKEFTVVVNPVADTPSVTDAVANGDNQTTDGLVILPNDVDGTEVNHFKITNILFGELYLNDGSTPVIEGDFISASEASKGLRFIPTMGSIENGTFDIQAATGNDDSFLGGAIITATIIRNSFPISNGFAAISVDEDAIIPAIDLDAIFDDPDNDDAELSYNLILNSNPELFDTIEIANHSLNLTLALNQFGNAQLTIEAVDPYGAATTDTLNVSVLPINDPPFLETPPIGLGNQDLPYEYNIVFTDPENQAITINTFSIPDWLSFENIDNGTARIFGTPTDAQVGIEHEVIFFAYDTEQDSTVVPYTMTVQNENDPPEITSVQDSVIEVGDFYDYLITADDKDLDVGDVLSFTIELLDGSDVFLNYQDNKNGTATIFGTPPSGTIGNYTIRIVVKDLALDSAVQTFQLRVKKANSLPVVSSFTVTTDEDISYVFSLDEFKGRFNDADGDSLVNIQIVDAPITGDLYLYGSIVEAGDTIDYQDIDSLTFQPAPNNNNNDFFAWAGFDGTDYSLIPRNVNVTVNSVKDPPEILEFEQNSILFEFANTEGAQLTEGTVFDGDGENIQKVTISFTENYVKGQDSIYYDLLINPGLTYFWEDSAGVLTITGLQSTEEYTDAVQALRYINTNPLAPSIDIRTIEILIYDAADEVSIPYLRQIEFENTFVDLNIPTGITPNDDGVNDTWNIINIERYPDIRVSVYSRSGELIFNSIGYQTEWDGTSDGEVLPPGPYYYAIRIEKYQQNYTGTISILR